jgi:hypothetical protein
VWAGGAGLRGKGVDRESIDAGGGAMGDGLRESGGVVSAGGGGCCGGDGGPVPSAASRKRGGQPRLHPWNLQRCPYPN